MRALLALAALALLLAPTALAAEPTPEAREGLASLLTAVGVLVHEYEEHVKDGAYDAEGEPKVRAALDAVDARWAAVEPDVRATHAHEADEIDEGIETLHAKIAALAPLADVELAAEFIEHEAQEVAGESTSAAGSFGDAEAAFAQKLHEIEVAYEAGDKDAALRATQEAYLDVYAPLLEARILAADKDLNEKIERLLNDELKAAISGGATVAEVERIIDEIKANVAQARAQVEGGRSAVGSFFDSFIILVREGFEAMLVVGALVTYVIRTGRKEKAKLLYAGAAAALAATLVLYLVVRAAFANIPAAYREIIEGATALLAVVVLFYVSYWLINKVETAKWNRFVQGKMKGALAKGSASALVSVSFLAVFREGFETVLFYQGLSAAGGASWAILLGVLAGTIVLAAAGLAFYRFGIALPLRPFFIVTSALLYYLAIAFAGRGIHELQEAGVVATTHLPGLAAFLQLPGIAFAADMLGVFPNVEALAAQAFLVVAILVGLGYTFVVEPRRRVDAGAADA